LSITHCLRLNLQLHTIDLVRTCRISSFCTVAWQLARFQLTRSLGDSWASFFKWEADNNAFWMSGRRQKVHGAYEMTVKLLLFLRFRTSNRWGRGHYVFELSVCACVPGRRHSMIGLPSTSSVTMNNDVINSKYRWFLYRLDRTLQDLIYKLVPGLLSRKFHATVEEYLIQLLFLTCTF